MTPFQYLIGKKQPAIRQVVFQLLHELGGTDAIRMAGVDELNNVQA